MRRKEKISKTFWLELYQEQLAKERDKYKIMISVCWTQMWGQLGLSKSWHYSLAEQHVMKIFHFRSSLGSGRSEQRFPDLLLSPILVGRKINFLNNFLSNNIIFIEWIEKIFKLISKYNCTNYLQIDIYLLIWSKWCK